MLTRKSNPHQNNLAFFNVKNKFTIFTKLKVLLLLQNTILNQSSLKMFLPVLVNVSAGGRETSKDFFQASIEQNSFGANGLIVFNILVIVVATPLLVNIIYYEGSGFSKQRIFVNKLGQ